MRYILTFVLLTFCISLAPQPASAWWWGHSWERHWNKKSYRKHRRHRHYKKRNRSTKPKPEVNRLYDDDAEPLPEPQPEVEPNNYGAGGEEPVRPLGEIIDDIKKGVDDLEE